MTVSLNKKSKDQRYRLDSDLMVSDRDVSLADVQGDEDAIDRLLVNTGFDTNPENESEKKRDVIIDELDLSGETDEFLAQPTVRKIEPKLKPLDMKFENTASSLMASIDAYTLAKKNPGVDGPSTKEDTSPDLTPEPWLFDDSAIIAPLELDQEDPLKLEDLVSLVPLKQDRAAPFVDTVLNDAEGKLDIKATPLLLDDDPVMAPLELEGGNPLPVEDLIELNINQHANENAVTDIEPSSKRCSEMDVVTPECPSAVDQFLADQRVINERHERLIGRLASRTKTAMLLSYAALAIGATAVLSAWVVTVNNNPHQMDTHAPSKQSQINPEGEPSGDSPVATYRLDPEESESKLDSHNSGTTDHVQPKAGDSAPTAKALSSDSSQSNWYVNLISFKERSDADAKAVDFIKKGIRTEVVEVSVNKALWYRLRVGGFTSNDQASAYAEKTGKTLRLNSIWISPN